VRWLRTGLTTRSRTKKFHGTDQANDSLLKLGDELTVLGWAVYYGFNYQAEEVIRFAISSTDTDPFLTMKSGFFQGKTAKDISEYYSRKQIVQLLDSYEKTKDESARNANEARKLAESKKVLESRSSARQSRSTVRSSRYLSRTRSTSPIDKKTKTKGEANFKDQPSSSSQQVVADFEMPTSPNRGEESREQMLKRRSEELQVMNYLEKANIPVDDQVLLGAALRKAGMKDVDSIQRADRTSLQRLKIKPVLISKILQAKEEEDEETVPPISSYEKTSSNNAVVEEKQDYFRLGEPSTTEEDDVHPLPVREVMTTSSYPPSKSLTEDESLSNSRLVSSANVFGFNQTPRGKRFHLYLSYNWGAYQSNRSRVRLMARVLESRGLLVFLGEDRFEDDIMEQILQGLQLSVAFVACLTRSYVNKVEALSRPNVLCLDWCAAEFSQAKTHSAIGKSRMIPLVMETMMMDERLWTGEVAVLKGRKAVDFTSDRLEQAADELVAFLDEISSSS